MSRRLLTQSFDVSFERLAEDCKFESVVLTVLRPMIDIGAIRQAFVPALSDVVGGHLS